MMGPVRRTLKLWLLGIRDMLASAGPVAMLAAALLVAAYVWLDPQPPHSLTFATGPAGSAYAAFGERYAKALAREGITSLGALFYEPMWIFVRAPALADAPSAQPAGSSADAPLAAASAAAFSPPVAAPLARLKGLRVNIDTPGSGVPEVLDRLLRASGLALADLRVSEQPAGAAAQALRAGGLDAVVLMTAPEAPVVQELLRTPGVALLEVAQADAYARRFPFLQGVTLPRGVVDLAADIPPRDVTLLAATTSLLTREDTHPALRQLLAQAAQGLHSGAGWLHRAREFPNTRTSELPVSPEGDRAINGTPPFWQRYLPFWASNLLERMWLVIGGLIVLLLPLSRVVPPLYTYRVRQRVFRWYARLRAVEAQIDEGLGEREALLNELDELDRVANGIAVPLAHADELFALRNNIDAVRRRLLGKRPD